MAPSSGQEISVSRKRGKEMTVSERAVLVSRRESGATIPQLMAEFHCSRNAVRNTLTRWKQHHTLESLPRSGRPKILTDYEERKLHRASRKHPNLKYEDLVVEATLDTPTPQRPAPPSRSTMYRSLKGKDLTKSRCKKKPKNVEGT